MKPNLFHYATSELSQDALFLWLINWAKPEHKTANEEIHNLGCDFVRLLIDKDIPITSIQTRKQEKNMDIKVINLDKNKLLQLNNYSDIEKEKYLMQSLYPGLGLKVIVKDYQLTEEINDKKVALAYHCGDNACEEEIKNKTTIKTRVVHSYDDTHKCIYC